MLVFYDSEEVCYRNIANEECVRSDGPSYGYELGTRGLQVSYCAVEESGSDML